MRKRRLVTIATTVLGIVSLLCLLEYYLALHDIFQDYASPKVLLEQLQLDPGTLPDWTACPLEWQVAGIGFWLMMAFHIVFLTRVIWHAKSRNDNIPN